MEQLELTEKNFEVDGFPDFNLRMCKKVARLIEIITLLTNRVSENENYNELI